MHRILPRLSAPAQAPGERGPAPRGAALATPSSRAAARVAIAGATGYTGQELLRILGRHPAVSVTAAMSSGASARRLPALRHIWDGEIVALSTDRLVQDADIVFLAVPDATAAELAPALVAAGVRVI